MTTWTPVATQSETWTSEDRARRTFSPYTFSRWPVFDTGLFAGVWDARAKQAETWTAEA